MSQSDSKPLLRAGLALGLVLAIAAIYAQVLDFGFIHYDDPRYVWKNPYLAEGLTWDFFAFAFSFDAQTIYQGVSNWHPLTWLSYGLDVTLFGVDAGAMHGVNGLLHVINALLVFVLFDRTTRAPLASAAVALLFAIHPLHVEAVAWIAERKELLSTLFGLLACHAWVGYARASAGGHERIAFAAAVLCHGLSLLAKPMWVTLPFLLLTLDHWPLNRTAVPLRRRLLEKLPFLALAILSGAATLYAQADAIDAAHRLGLFERLANAAIAPAHYLALTVWPAHLSILYPHPFLPGGSPPSALGWLKIAGLFGVIAALAYRTRDRGYVLAGLAWFGIALGPVLGVLQVGEQAIADRYTYVSLIGIFALVCFGARDALASSPVAVRRGAACVVLIGFALLGVRCADQVAAWSDSITLYQKSVIATPSSAMLRFNLGNRLMDAGREAEAIIEYEAAIVARPAWADPKTNQAWLLATTGDASLVDGGRARELALAATTPDGSNANALDTLAAAYAAANEFEKAAATAARATQLAHESGQRSAAINFERRRRLYLGRKRYVRPNHAEDSP